MTDAVTDGQGAAPTGDPVQPDAQDAVQPDSADAPSSQGLIEPYLEGLDPTVREQVAPVLEQFRSDQDARVQEKLSKEAARRKAYEQYGEPEQVGLATQIVQSFMADPVKTTEWLIEQGKTELGVDIMAALREAGGNPEPTNGAADTVSNEPLTADKVLEVIQQHEQQKQAETRRQTIQQQQAQQAAQRAVGWFEDAVKRHNVPADTLPDGVKESMFIRAQSLRDSGLAADGKTAIDMAVAEFGQAFAKVGNGSQPQPSAPEPTVATGGGSPPPQGYDVTDEKQRRAAMAARLAALTGAG